MAVLGCFSVVNFFVIVIGVVLVCHLSIMRNRKFEKGSWNYHGHMMTDYIIETGTKTENGNTCNRRNVFGEPFEYKSYLNASNSTFEMDWSSAKVVLPEKLLRSAEVEIHGSTFRSIPCVKTKFGIPDDEAIASPVVEYYITGYPWFTDHAVCILPFIGKPEDVCVKKFRSDEERNLTTSSDVVPEKGKYNGDSDLFYMIKDSHVYIYTRSFSGFYCTTCGNSRQLNLRAFLFGSYKKLQRFEIRMAVYIADEIFKFKDFKKRMYEIETMQGRVQKFEKPLNLLPDLTDNDLLRLYITPTGLHTPGRWIHVLHPVNDMPIMDIEKAIPLKLIVMCHNPSEVPYFVEWYLCNTGEAPPDYKFQCVVDINCETRGDNSAVTKNSLVVDELDLRAQDLPACTGQVSGWWITWFPNGVTLCFRDAYRINVYDHVVITTAKQVLKLPEAHRKTTYVCAELSNHQMQLIKTRLLRHIS